MRGLSRLAGLAIVVLLVRCAMAAETSPLGITVPEGFTVEIACEPPLVKHPLMADFDDRGRLYVAESAGLNLEADALLRDTPNFIRRLEDVDGDGRFDRSTIFADRMTMPMGALWHGGALYVASPPYIWRLEDTNDDGVADRREAIVGKFGFIGNAADIHGCFLGPNGRLYWCDGRHGHEFVDAKGQTRSKGKAARIFSCRLDGSDIQAHCGGGMDNPVEVDFTAEGEMLGTVNLFYQQRGDCLVHWMHGGVYPRYDQEAVLAEFRRTGDLLPPVIDLGHVAVSGMTRYRGSEFGREYDGQLFITLFNTRQVVSAKLEREGSTFRGQTHEFWTSSNPDCHPTDVLQDADGSLLIIDTGGWFRYGCPTSQVAKPEIQGAIYRVRRTDAPTMADPRGQQLAWAELGETELANLLTDARPKVVDRAIEELARRGATSIDALRSVTIDDTDIAAKQSAIWALTRIELPSAFDVVRLALDDADASVRQTAVASISTTLDRSAAPRLRQMVRTDALPVRREAATALGRIGDRSAVPELLATAADAADRILEHAAIYALIEMNAPTETMLGLSDDDPRVRRVALIALDQMAANPLTPDIVSQVLSRDDPPLQQAAIEIIRRRDGWAREFVDQLTTWMQAPALDVSQRDIARGALTALIEDEAVQDLVADVLHDQSTQGCAIALEALAQVELSSIPPAWEAGLRKSLHHQDSKRRGLALAAIRLQPQKFTDEVRLIAAEDSADAELQLAATLLLAGAGETLRDTDWRRLLQALESQNAPLQRLRVADAIGQAKLTSQQLRELMELLPHFGALELASALRSFSHCADEELGRTLLDALKHSAGLDAVTPVQIRDAFASQPTEVQTSALALLQARRGDDATDSIEQLARLEANLSTGDPARGREIFFGNKAGCSACHSIEGQGARVGPDLSKIGAIRTRRDLLEALALPSSSLARGYESYLVTTDEGRTFHGMIQRETPHAIWLRTSDRSEHKLSRDQIDALELSPQSIMPQGLMNLLDAQEQSDLLAYLSSLR